VVLPFASSSAFQLLTNALGKQLAAHQAHCHALPLQGNHGCHLALEDTETSLIQRNAYPNKYILSQGTTIRRLHFRETS